MTRYGNSHLSDRQVLQVEKTLRHPHQALKGHREQCIKNRRSALADGNYRCSALVAKSSGGLACQIEISSSLAGRPELRRV